LGTEAVTRQREAAVRERIVLVTGGSGFLGAALVERLIEAGTAEVRTLARTAAGGTGRADRLRVRAINGDLQDERAVRAAMRGVQVVFHLAAIKSVEICENEPAKAIATNVRGSGVLIKAALAEPSVERFVAVSSDKAANPTGVYGLTKAVMERMVADAQRLSNADFGIVRCGSLWASTGSVIALWRRAAAARQGLLVTDPAMTRFVMLRPDAVDLLFEATSRTMAGDILARVMPAYLLGDLAAVVSQAHAVAVHTTGGRSGEKTHDDLISEQEAPFTARAGEFFRITPGRRNEGVEAFGSADARRLTRTELSDLVGQSGTDPRWT